MTSMLRKCMESYASVPFLWIALLAKPMLRKIDVPNRAITMTDR